MKALADKHLALLERKISLATEGYTTDRKAVGCIID
jgi:hypothetical protein